MKGILRALSLQLLGAALLLAEGPTVISDVLVTASGAPAGANLFISWSAFTTPGGVPVTAGQRAAVTDASGRFTVALLPCPTGTGCYTVNTASQGIGSQSFWSVYTSAVPLTVAQVQVGYSPGPSVQVSPQQISGGSSGQCLTWTSGVAGWGSCAGSAAVASVFGRSGTVVAASGDYTTAQVTESGNLYFLNSRAIAAMAGLYEVPLTFDASLNRSANTITISSGGVTNAMLANAATTVFGASCALGATCTPTLPNPSASTLGGVQSYTAVANQFIDSVSTSGIHHSRAIVAADVPPLNQNTTGNAATATALAATPTKCGAGNYPLGVDVSGNAQNCTAAPTGITAAVSIPLGPMGATDSYTFAYTSAGGWSLTVDFCAGSNVPMAHSGYYNAFWQWSSSNSNCIGRWFWIPADYDNVSPVTITFDFGPDAGSGTGNFGLKASIGCVTSGTTTWAAGYPTQNAFASTGAVAVAVAQYTHQQGTTDTLSMTGCPAGALGKIIVQRDLSVASNSATTLDLLDAKFNYSRK